MQSLNFFACCLCVLYYSHTMFFYVIIFLELHNEVICMGNTGIKESVIYEIIELAKKYNLNKVILFGSRARGDFQRASDIDLAVSGGNIPMFALDVEEETSTLLQFGVVDLDKDLQDNLLKSIREEGIVLYKKGEIQCHF